LDAVNVLLEVGRGDTSTALVLAMHYNSHGNLSRNAHWPREIYEKVVQSSLDGVALINGVSAEPILGSPSRGAQFHTTATEEADGWRINGHKKWATGSVGLAWMSVTAKTADGNQNGSWLVPGGTPGVNIIEGSWNQLGMRATASHDIIFDNVWVPKNHLLDLRDPTISFNRSHQSGAWFAFTISAAYLGAARAAQNFLVEYVQQRTPTSLGVPLSKAPRIREQIGHIELLLRGAERLTRDIARQYDESPESLTGNEVGAIKQVVRNLTIEAAERAVNAVGHAGTSRDYPLERYYRDVIVGRAHGPQFDSSCLALATEALGPLS
jgi:alkylation response protein AidB-like acyl-CoA dehydrogenase